MSIPCPYCKPETWRDKLNDLIPGWMHRTWSYLRYDIHQGLYGLWYWASFAWRWRTWDYGWILEAMELHLKKLEVAVREGHAENREKPAKQMRIALELLRRLRADGVGEYWERYQRKEITIEQYKRLEQRDWDMLWNICRRYMRHWWD